MASYKHSWQVPLRAGPPALRRRTASSSSEASHGSAASHSSEEPQFAFSPVVTPSTENPPSQAASSRPKAAAPTARDGLLFGCEVNTRLRNSEHPSAPTGESTISPTSRSKPIAIELPVISGPASNPPEPLSARGDIPGGYFPLHEDPQTRVRVPHPFHQDADMARRSSLQRAAESSKSSTHSHSLGAAHISLPSQPAMSNPTSASMSPDTPLSSYIPIGVHEDVVLPLGKYYPSNWERRHGKATQSRPPPTTTSQPTAAAFMSEPQVPTYRSDQGHPRSGSDAKRRLQQYQRDMVAQAAMAANAVLANSTSASTSAAAAPAALGGGATATLSRTQLAAAATLLKTHRPVSPRLKPLGSPGPVTPMSLEDDSHMTLGRPGTTGADAGEARDAAEPAADANANANRTGRGRYPRDSRSSPYETGNLSI